MTTTPRLFHFVKPYYEHPLRLAYAEDCYIVDESGRRYLDAYAGVATVAVGHAHPKVNAAAKAQADLGSHSTMLYPTRALQAYLEALQPELPDALCRHFFVNSGSEALDFACQSARAHRRRPLLIAFSEGFHGGSFQAKSVTGLDAWQPAFGNDPHVVFVPVSSCRDCPESGWKAGSKRLTPLELRCSARCLDPLADLLDRRSEEVAGLVVEPVLGVGGVLSPCRGFFDRLQALVDRSGIDLIVDEVQSGFGRCGTGLFAFSALGLRPDLLCLAKGIANGFPLGLTVGTEEISAAMGTKLHFSTFGGNPVSCAAALATLGVLRDENLVANARVVGEALMADLDRRLIGLDPVREIRGLGLFIGIELDSAERARAVHEECFRHGLLIGLGGRLRNVLRIEPPLCFTMEMAARAAEILDTALRSGAL